MTETLVREKEAVLDAEGKTPHLSYSRIQRHLLCPEQYRLYYVEKLRARVESASLVFGAIVHLALAQLFRHGDDPIVAFSREWKAIREIELRYSRKETWQTLAQKGERLLRKFCEEHGQKIQSVLAVEKVFELGLSNLNLPFTGIIDLIAEMGGKRTLVEFKTAVADFEDYEIALLDQLSAYQLAEPDIELVAVCVFVKTKKPRIEWHVTKRTPEQVVEYVDLDSRLLQKSIDEFVALVTNIFLRVGPCGDLIHLLGNRSSFLKDQAFEVARPLRRHPGGLLSDSHLNLYVLL